MAKFTKLSNNTIKLNSNGSIKDGLLVASWARNLISSCNAEAHKTEVAYNLSAAHKTNYSVEEVILSFSDYFFNDISFWLHNCKS